MINVYMGRTKLPVRNMNIIERYLLLFLAHHMYAYVSLIIIYLSLESYYTYVRSELSASNN